MSSFRLRSVLSMYQVSKVDLALDTAQGHEGSITFRQLSHQGIRGMPHMLSFQME